MDNTTKKWVGILLAALLGVASTSAIAQKAQSCADEDGNPVACSSDGLDSADGTGMESADGTGLDSADGTGIDSAAGPGLDDTTDHEEEDEDF